METEKPTSYTEQFKKLKAEREEAVLKEIMELPLEDGFIPPIGLPIPLSDEIILLPVMQNETTRASGIILPSAGDVSNDRKTGIIARIGPLVQKNLRIGMKVLFESRGNHFRFDATDGNEYLMVLQHNVYCAATPQTYVVPEFKTKLQKRDEERRKGFETVKNDERAKLNMSKEEKKELGINPSNI